MPKIITDGAPESASAETTSGLFDVEVFRAGDYGAKGVFDERDLESLVEEYNQGEHEAPVTLDHAQDGPAYGWVDRLEKRGSVLVARLRDVSGQLLEVLRSGRFKKPSIELNTDEYSEECRLRAVSFLGATIPEVKGLAPAMFREGEAGDDQAEERDVCDLGQVEAAGESGDATGQLPMDDSAGSAEDESYLEYHESALNVVRQLRKTGRWNSRWDEQQFVKFMEGLQRADGAVAEKGGGLFQWFEDFLIEQDPVVPFGEVAPASSSEALQFSCHGQSWSPGKTPHLPESSQLDAQARNLVAKEGFQYSEALRIVARQHIHF